MMSHQGEDKGRLRRQATRDAIQLAMESRWKEAAAVNKGIIESFPTEVDAYNRLGRALTELGEFAEARGAYGRAVELDPSNTIARKNLNRLSLLHEERQVPESDHKLIAPNLFIEERGRAGIVSMDNLASTNILARLGAGDQVYLRVEGQRLVVEDRQGTRLGQVEPRHASRLVKLILGGNKYSAAIASINQNDVKIVIKEVYQDPTQVGRLSFSLKEGATFRPYIRSNLLKLEAEDELLTLDDEGEYMPEADESEERVTTEEVSSLQGVEDTHLDDR
ncbi:MAG: tetratricopeptide repeat protein [Dehalococcoidia bacterium]|nr:tetratricopeptide repeat protein [Dehalococcoidia bacterium]